MTTKHAVYANCLDYLGRKLTIRVGQPTDWTTAQNRWLRLDDRRIAGRDQAVSFARRQYRPESFEVRSVDEAGRGLGSERHATAMPAPYRALRVR